MMRDDSLLRELALDAARAALDAGYQPDSYNFKSFLRGTWQVIADRHPEIADCREQFLAAAGSSDALH